MAVFRSFYRMVKTALFALGVFVFAFSESFAATSATQFVLYSDLTMSKVLGTFVGNWANMKLEDVIDGFVKNAGYQSDQDLIRCTIMDDEFQYVNNKVDFQHNWNIFNSFSVGISNAKGEFICYDFVNREVDCDKTTLELTVAQYNADCNYLYNSNGCSNAWQHKFSNTTPKCIQDAGGNAPCSEADHIISCWIETIPKNGFFMHIPVVTGGNGNIVLKSNSQQVVTDVLMDGPYFDTWRLTGVPSNQNLVFDGFLLSATDTKGNYYPLRYIATNGTVYNLFDNWYTSLTDGGDSKQCNALVGKAYNHATYDMTLKGTNACGNGYEIFDSKTTLPLLNNLYTNLPKAGFDVSKIVGYDPTNNDSWVPVMEQSGTVRLDQICSSISQTSSGNVVSKDLPICNIAGVDLSKAALDDYLGYTNNGLALVAVWASDDTHTYLTSLPASSSSVGPSCSTGYHSENVQTVIGNSEYKDWGFIDGNSDFYSNLGNGQLSTYGLTSGDTNAFGIVYDDGILNGHSACATTSGTTQTSITDATGQSGAVNCWCKVDGYRLHEVAALQNLSSSWVFLNYYTGNNAVGFCSDGCANACAKDIATTSFANNVIPSESVCVIDVYTITYNLNGGTNGFGNPGSYTIESLTITLTNPTKTGYTFGGWYMNSGFTGSAVTQISHGSTGNKTLYAKWTPTSYTISYNLDGGTNDANNPASYTIESQTITFADPTKTGYTFGGWYTDSGFNTPITQIQTGSTGNKTLYAKWTSNSNSYTITYNLNGGTNDVNNPANYTAESQTITFADPTKSGYIFGGWYTDSTFETPITQIQTGSTGNKTLYAKWFTSAFTLTTTSTTSSFQFIISATGEFAVDCGDGGSLSGTGVSGNVITRSNTTPETYTCQWGSAGAHQIKFGGEATGYSPNNNSAIKFSINPTYSNSVWSDVNAAKISTVSGSLGSIFPDDANFNATFAYATNLTSVPNTLFTGSNQSCMSKFDFTFAYSGITSIPVGLFPAMASDTDLYNGTFANSALATIPSNFTFGITGGSDSSLFAYTFAGTHITSVPENIFAGITGWAESMFESTFENSLLATIPAGLFQNIQDDNESAFNSTFRNTQITQIPANLFARVTDVNDSMFAYTFADCANLESLPENLFANVSYIGANGFEETFSGSGLESLPNSMFPSYDSSVSSDMFWGMFKDNTSLSGYIPPRLFSTIRLSGNQTPDYIMSEIFDGDTSLWTSCEAHGMTQYITGFEDAWDAGNNNTYVSCIDTSDGSFYIALEDTDEFDVELFAGGNFTIDWGDGNVSNISKTVRDVQNEYHHDYSTSGNYLVKISGRATAYLPENDGADSHGSLYADISFSGLYDDTNSYYSVRYITAVYGSLGSIFPPINGKPPRMTGLFTGATNLTSVPANLFSGITGCTRSEFESAFRSTGLTTVPANLFSGVTCTRESIFEDAFYMSDMETVPVGLLSGISGEPATNAFAYMFSRSELDGFIMNDTNHTVVPYVPYSFYKNISETNYNTNRAFDDAFKDPGSLAEVTCPSNTIQLEPVFYTSTNYNWDTGEGKTVTCCNPNLETCPAYTITLNNGSATTAGSTAVYTIKEYNTGVYTDEFTRQNKMTSNANPITVPQKTGYDFYGYYTAQSGGNQVIDSGGYITATGDGLGTGYTSNQTWYAHWTAKELEYTVYCNSEKDSLENLGSGRADYGTNFNIGIFSEGLSDCSEYSSYNFAGWSCEHRDDNNVSPVNYGNVNSLSWTYDDDIDIACYANWTPSYTVTYNANGGNVSPSSATYTGTALTLPTPTRTDYIFAGWYDAQTNGNLVGAAGASYTPNADNITLYAHWEETKFTVATSTISAGGVFKFQLSAAGTFAVDCGNGGSLSSGVNDVVGNLITRSNNTTLTQYTCTYSTAGTKEIRFGGLASAYNNSVSNENSVGAISFSSTNSNTPDKIVLISGSLGSIFPSDSNKVPRFFETFRGATALTSLPATLFTGINHSVSSQFSGTFRDCTALTSLPVDSNGESLLFKDITDLQLHNFTNTFVGSGLTTLPHKMFNLGTTGTWVFFGTFRNSAVTTIPSDLFVGLTSATRGMFSGTFENTQITSIPQGLFANVTSASSRSFEYTFSNCSNLTTVPYNLFAGLTGTPEEQMFYKTFENDTNLETFDWGNNVTTSYIPKNFFGSLASTPDEEDFMTDVFNNTKVAISCPSGMAPYTTGFEDYWYYPSATTVPGQKVSCDIATYTVTYNVNGGNALDPSSVTVNAGSSTTLPTPTRTGYDCSGWYDEQNTFVGAGGATYGPVNSNITLYAQWTLNTYTITLDKNANDATAGTLAIYEKSGTGFYSDFDALTSISQITVPTRSGYDFIGYYNAETTIRYIDENGNILASNNTFTSDTTLYAQWALITNSETPDPDTPSSTFCPRYEDTPDYQNVQYAKIGNRGAMPANDYYYYYYSPAGATNKLAGCQLFYAVSNNLISNVDTTISGYNYTMFRSLYNPTTGNYEGGTQIQYSGVPTTVSLHCASGYSNGSASNGMIQYSSLYGANGAIQNACTATTYTITYELNGGTNYDNAPTEYTIATPTITFGTPTKTNNVFDGWYTEPDFQNQIIQIAQGSTGDKSLYAKWSQCDACDAGTGASCQLSVVNNVCTYTTTCLAGYDSATIVGNGTKSPSCSPAYIPITLNNQSANTQSNPTTVYLKYTDGWYYKDSNDQYVALPNNTITAIPQKTEYIFGGYYTATNGGGTQIADDSGVFSTATTPTNILTFTTSATTIYAKWTLKKYRATYNCGPSSSTPPTDSNEYAKGNSIRTATADSCSVPNGYSQFKNWKVTGNDTGTDYGTKSANSSTSYSWSEDVTFTANFQGNSISIKYDENGGQSVSDKNCYYGDTGIVLPNDTKSGSVFAGWKTYKKDANNNVITYSAGDTIDCTYEYLGVYSGNSTNVVAQWTICPGDSYCPGDNTQTLCPEGYTANTSTGKSAQSDCKIACPCGTYLASQKATSCTACASGKYKEAHQIGYNQTSQCISAPAGSYVPDSNKCSAVQCAAGSYNSSSGKSNCQPCAKGKTSGVGATSCSNCSNNTSNVYSWLTPSWNSNNTVSNVCEIDKCYAGAYYDNNTCPTCTNDTYSSSNGATSCTACLTGYHTKQDSDNKSDHDSVSDCKIHCYGGSYLPVANASTCTDVGAGYWAAAADIIQGQTNSKNQCTVAGETTCGHGACADDIYDCGRRLHVGSDLVWLKSAKDKTPSIAIPVNGKKYYARMSRVAFPMNEGEGDFFKTRYNNKEWYIHDDAGEAKIYDVVFKLTNNVTLEANTNGFLSNDGTYKNKQSAFGLVDTGTWGADYGYGRLIGESSCSTTAGTNYTANPDLVTYRDSVGTNCWCRLTKSDNIRVVLSWVNIVDSNVTSDCARNCARSCSNAAANSTQFRRALFSGVAEEQEQECDSCLPGTGASCELTDAVNCVYTTSCLTGYHGLTGNGTSSPSCTPNTYTVKYNANGGSGSMSDSTYTYGTYYNLPSKSFTRSGYTFAGWALTSSSTTVDYADKAQVINLSSTDGGIVTLYAVWGSNSQTPVETDYDTSINGYRQGSLSHAHGSSSAGTLGLTVDGTWGVDFKYDGSSAPMTRVKGQASCNTTIGIVNNANSSLSASVTDVSGPNCWCRSSQIGKVSGSTESNMTSAVSDWVFYGTIKNTTECTKQCAKNCATNMNKTSAFRTAIYGSI